MCKVLDHLLESSLAVTVIQGGAAGADRIALEWAKRHFLPCETFEAEWGKYGRRAGFLRNSRMLKEGKPTNVVAFVDKPLQESKGTAMMVRIAQEAGVPVTVYEPDSLAEKVEDIESLPILPVTPEQIVQQYGELWM